AQKSIDGDAKGGLSINFHLVEDGLPDAVHHSTSYGGQWTSDWCVVLETDGSIETARRTVSEIEKDEFGNRQNPHRPWRGSDGTNRVVAWAYAAEVRAAIDAIAQQGKEGV